jgi:hypothetical protein
MVESYPIPNGLTTEKAMLLAAAVVDRCMLCDEAPAYLGIFVAGNSHAERYIAAKAKPGKSRGIYYGLCSECFALPDKAQRVEGALESSATRARN